MNQPQLPGMETPPGYHDFKEKLIMANVNTSLMRLDLFYKARFPHVETVQKVEGIGLQKQGVDTIATLTNGKQVYFDEKIRAKAYPDILLEEFSVWRGYPFLHGHEIDIREPATNWQGILKPGWISGEKITDYIVYVKKPTRQVYFLPFLLLQSAWLKHYPEWLLSYGRKAARNSSYHTTNIPIPTEVLYQALYEEKEW